MKIKEIRFAKGYAIVANYNKVSFEAEVSGILEEGDTVDEGFKQAQKFVMTQLGEQIDTATEELKAFK